MNGGHISPMIKVEDKLVGLIIQMARIRHPLTPSGCLQLANDFISGTQTEKDVIDFKTKYCFNNSKDGERLLGRGYFKGFKKRNAHRIVSKRGQKYEMDRDNWTTYRNFSNMYDHVIEEMCDAGVAEKLDSPVWMDRDGKECQPIEAFGCKVTHRIKHPDMCIVGDEVGGNTSQKGDGHIGGTLHLCERNFTPQSKTSNKDKRFTLMGLTTLTGKPLMCCVIFKGVKCCIETETGIDFTVPVNSDSNTQQDQFKDNLEDELASFEPLTGKGKLLPGGPTCMFKGKVVPCFIRWSESGGMSSIILKEIFETIDHFQLLPRTPGVLPFAMLDGHGSRLELPFLKYINNKTTEWCVCLGVPYGTAYWQVGDSKEQNGSFNMAMTDAKRKLLDLKRKFCMNATIDKNDLMLLINIAWNKSFARVDKNRRAIADRGWGPYNRNILTFSHIRATMTETDRIYDLNYQVVLSCTGTVPYVRIN